MHYTLLFLFSTAAASPLARNDNLFSVPLIRRSTANTTTIHANTRGLAQGHTLVKDAFGPSTVYRNVIDFIPTYFGTSVNPEELLIDTGSAVTTVGLQAPFVPQGITQTADTLVPLNYVGGLPNFQGTPYQGQVTFLVGNMHQGYIVNNQVFGVANNPVANAIVAGVLGLGPVALTKGKYSNRPDAEITTIADNLCVQKNMQKQFAIYLEPSRPDGGSDQGSLTFCGYDTRTYAPQFYPIAPTQRTLNGVTNTDIYLWALNVKIDLVLSNSATPTTLTASVASLDSGPNLLGLNPADFATYQALVGGTVHPQSGYVEIPVANYVRIPVLRFSFMNGAGTVLGGVVLPQDAQIVPPGRVQNIPGARAGYLYLRVSTFNFGSLSNNFVIGTPFLERYYTVYNAPDAAAPAAQNAGMIGIAPTAHTCDVTSPGAVPAQAPASASGGGCLQQ